VPSGGPSGHYDAMIAVASNFFDAAQNMISDYSASLATPQYINICQNSTAELYGEITASPAPGTSGYALFMAANATTPQSLQGSGYEQTSATAQLYAMGIPVLLARYATVTDIHSLIPSQSSGVWATINYQVSSADQLNTTNAQEVAVADPAAAPYGAAAMSILGDMGYTLSPIPSWIHTPLYANIDLTFQSVATSPYPNKSGFVSEGQICSGIGMSPPTYIYAEFTNSAYTLSQDLILIKSGNSTQNGIGSAIQNWMLSNADPGYWSGFLDENCYGQISGSQLFLHTGMFRHKKPPFKPRRGTPRRAKP